MKIIGNKLFCFLLVLTTIFLSPELLYAAPYFKFEGNSTASVDTTYTLDVHVVSDGSTLTAMQTIVDFDENYFNKSSLSILSSACSFWAPADPTLGYGNTPSPYFYPSSSSNEVVLSCGVVAPGYTSADADGDRVLRIRLTPTQTGVAGFAFDSTNTLFRYISTEISADTMTAFNVTIGEASSSSSTTPTATATSSGGGGTATPTSTSTASATPTATPQSALNVTDTLTEDELDFVEIGVNSSTSNGTATENVSLEIIDEDDSIPDPPELEPRAPATPFVFNLLNNLSGGGGSATGSGEVLAAQSLRDLLIPGKSTADKTVVLFNLISTLTFLVLLAIVLWRLITITRMNKLKSRHMKELLVSELAVLESKLGNTANTEEGNLIKEEIEQAMRKLNDEKQ